MTGSKTVFRSIPTFALLSLVALGAAGCGSDPVGPGSIEWLKRATEFRGQNGSQFTFVCEPGGTARSVWGTDIYTDDSSICTAAVHAGRITLEEGGSVTIEIQPGRALYIGSRRNGITSADYPAWDGSFIVR